MLENIDKNKNYITLLNSRPRLNILFQSLYCNSQWSHKNVVSPFSRLYFLLDGCAILETKGQKVVAKKGEVVLIPSGIICSYTTPSFLHKFYFHFRLERNGFDLLSHIGKIMKLSDIQEEVAKIIVFANSNHLSEPSAMLYLESILLRTLSKIDLNIQKSSLNSEVELALNYIDSNASASLDVDALAYKFGKPGQSRAAFTKRFLVSIGESPKQCLNRILLQRAQDLLLTESGTVLEIARKLGFGDPYYFSRFFKKNCGLSPVDYRKRNRF